MRFFGILKMWRRWQKAFVQIAQRGIWGGWKPRKYWEFPHCMWGCIIGYVLNVLSFIVPSLYVRVYRHRLQVVKESQSFLTVCEGVSNIPGERTAAILFPHCMWGCINTFRLCWDSAFGSLTVCEGVSKPHWHVLIMFALPHYTWGCIDTSRKEWNV